MSKSLLTFLILAGIALYIIIISRQNIANTKLPTLNSNEPRQEVLTQPTTQPTVKKSINTFEKDITYCLNKSFSAKYFSQDSTEPEQASPFKILLFSRKFEPTENTNETLKCFDSVSHNIYYAFIQFYEPLKVEEKEFLKLHGIELIRYISKNAWIASFSKPISEKTEVAKLIRWVGVYLPQDKVEISLWNGKIHAIDPKNPDLAIIMVQLIETVPEQSAQDLIQSYEGEVINYTKSTHTYTIKVPKNWVKQLAEENIVEYIRNVEPQMQPNKK